MTDETMEMARCNWVNARFCEMHMVKDGSRICSTGYPCEHKALAKPEKGPTCPKCGNVLYLNKAGLYVCLTDDGENDACEYSQFDSAQRPKMPEPREGYHAGEFRPVVLGEHYFTADGDVVYKCGGDMSPRWIAVKDEVKPEPAKVICPNCKSEMRHYKGEPNPIENMLEGWACPRCPNAIIEKTNDHIADAGKMVGPAKLPVVEYWRRVGSQSHPERSNYVFATIGGRVVESYLDGVLDANAEGDSIMVKFYIPITPAEYEAAKHPPADVRDSRRRHLDGIAEGMEDDKMIESLSDNIDTGRQHLKIQELVGRVNKLEQRLRELEGRKGK